MCAQPGFGVVVMCPQVGDDGLRSTGPNEPSPIAVDRSLALEEGDHPADRLLGGGRRNRLRRTEVVGPGPDGALPLRAACLDPAVRGHAASTRREPPHDFRMTNSAGRTTTARSLRAAAGDAIEQELRAHRPERLCRLLHDGEEGIQARGVFDVVEADERDVVGNLETGCAHRFDRAESDEVVDGEHRGRRIVELEQPAHPLVTAGGIDCRVCDERRIDRDPGGGQGGLVASPPVACGRHLVGLDDEADAAMAERDQVLDELSRPAEAVAEDDVGLDAGNRAVDQHEGDSELREPAEVASSTGR